MLSSIRIHGLGPHLDTTLTIPEPMGRTVVSGPSESGKSSIAEAVCFALWGRNTRGGAFDPAFIPDEAKGASVLLSMSSGTQIERHRSRKGSWRRIVRKGGEEFEYATDEQMTAALGALSDRELCRNVIVPLAWVPLAQDSTGGRPFRDLLAGIIPGGTLGIVKEAMGANWSDDLPTTEKGAVEARREANRLRDQAQGKLDGHRQNAVQAAAAVASVILPSDGEVGAALAVGATVALWEVYDHDLAWWDARSQASADYEKRVAAWQTESDAIAALTAEMPAREHYKRLISEAYTARQAAQQAMLRASTLVSTDIARRKESAGQAVREAKQVLDHEQQRLREARGSLETARKQVAQLDGVPCRGWQAEIHGPVSGRGADGEPDAGDGTWVDCGTCLFLADAKVAAESIPTLEAAIRAVEQGTIPAMEQAAREAADRAAGSLEADQRLSLAASKGRESEEAALSHEATIQTQAQDHSATWAALDARTRALGQKPQPPADIGPKPQPPRSDRPSAEEVSEAVAFVERAKRLVVERGAAVKAQTQADATLKASEEGSAKAEAKAAVLERLVEAVRSAPSTLAKRAVQALGDLGPVEVRFEGDGAKLYIDGREAREPLVSRGRIALADAAFRQGLRRAIKRTWLPIIIDNAQDYEPSSEQAARGDTWASIKGPVILLYTRPTKGGGLDVTRED